MFRFLHLSILAKKKKHAAKKPVTGRQKASGALQSSSLKLKSLSKLRFADSLKSE
jgi:hypothetical protein